MNSTHLRRKLEGIWWGVTLVVWAGVLLPVFLQTRHYPFYLENTLYIIVAITFVRYTFLLRHTFLAPLFWPKLLIMAFSAIMVFILVTTLGDFSTFIDDAGLQTLVGHLPIQRQYAVMHYIQNETIFFGVASVFGAIVLPLRMLISVWRMYNRGTV